MRFVKSAICFVIGHKWNEVALNHGYADCERCNYGQPCGPTEPFTIQNWLWWRRYYLGKFYRNLKYRISEKIKAWRKPDDDLDVPF